MSKKITPTNEIYSFFQDAYEHFNQELFANQLPPCMITLRCSSKAYGNHHTKRFISPDGVKIDEIGLNPGFFSIRPVQAILSTLAHEMVHQWQHHFGEPAKGAHNVEWAEKMEHIGLQPSKTGLPGGKRTGTTVTHYIVENGLFSESCAKFIGEGKIIPWMDRYLSATAESQEDLRNKLKEAGIGMGGPDAPLEQLINEHQEDPSDEDDDEESDNSVVIEPKMKAGGIPTAKTGSSKRKMICPACLNKIWTEGEISLICGTCNVNYEIR
jgi:hypothetical protein